MKKVLWSLVALLILAAAYAGASYLLGRNAEQRFRQTLAALPPTPLYHLAVAEYHRGLFQSSARVIIDIRPPVTGRSSRQGPWRLLLQQRVWHGPLPRLWQPAGSASRWQPGLALFQGRLPLVAGNQPGWARLADKLVLNNETLFHLNGDSDSSFSLPPFDLPLKGGKGTLRWKGFQGTLHHTAASGRFAGAASSEGMAGQAGTNQMELRPFRMEFDNRPTPTGVSVGHGSFHCNGLSLRINGREFFALGQIQVRSAVNEKKGLLAASQQFQLSRLLLEQSRLGPIRMILAVRNLDSQALAQLQTLMRRRQPPPSQAELLPLFSRLLRASPELELSELSIATSDGTAKGRLLTVFTADNAVPAPGPLALLTGLRVEAHVAVPEHLAAQLLTRLRLARMERTAEQRGESLPLPEANRSAAAASRRQLAALVAQGLLRHRDQAFSARLRYQQGFLRINDKKFSLVDLLSGNPPLPMPAS